MSVFLQQPAKPVQNLFFLLRRSSFFILMSIRDKISDPLAHLWQIMAGMSKMGANTVNNLLLRPGGKKNVSNRPQLRYFGY
jgi:hypothetical protein